MVSVRRRVNEKVAATAERRKKPTGLKLLLEPRSLSVPTTQAIAK